MRLPVRSAPVGTAFAAESLLDRAARAGGMIEPMSPALIRVAAGAALP